MDRRFEVKDKMISIKLDENSNPVIPEGWTFLIHGSSLDRWDVSDLGNDFVVGQSAANGPVKISKPLCCVERDDAKYDYRTRGACSWQTYGGKNHSFQIRVIYYNNLRTAAGKIVRGKLSPEQIKQVTKCYMFQGGRHPAIPVGTKLSFLKKGDFDEITNTNGNKILWYIPEEYLQQYLEDIEQMQDINKNNFQIGELTGIYKNVGTNKDDFEER